MKIAFLLFLIAGALEAQVASASLAGTVLDESSAVVAGAVVTTSQEGTGFSRTAITDARGDYLLEQLAPGVYTLTVEESGFRSYRAEQVILEVNQKARQEVRLVLGASRNCVRGGTGFPVQADSASIGYQMDKARIAELPLESRNVVALVTLGPGAIPRQLGGFVHDVVNDVQEARAARWRSIRRSTAAAPP